MGTVLKPAFEVEEDELDDIAEGDEDEDENEEEATVVEDAPDTPDTPASPEYSLVRVKTRSRPSTASTDFRITSSPRSKAFLRNQKAIDDISSSVNILELALKLHNIYYGTPLGIFIGSGVPSTSLYERWTRTRDSGFGNQLLDLMIRTARSEGNSDYEYDEDLSKDCQIFGITGNLVVTKGWISEVSLFNSLRDDALSEREYDANIANPSTMRDQRILQIYNLTPKIAASLCSKGHFLHSDANFDFLSSYINFQNSFRADVRLHSSKPLFSTDSSSFPSPTPVS